jgi:hypothetical protein
VVGSQPDQLTGTVAADGGQRAISSVDDDACATTERNRAVSHGDAAHGAIVTARVTAIVATARR